MLVAKMALNFIVTEGMAPFLNSSRSLAFRPNILLLTKCNATAALKANHFRQLGVTMRNLKTITNVIVLNIPRRTIPGHCRERCKREIYCPRHTHAPSCTTTQRVNLGSTAGGHLDNLGGIASDCLLYACLHITNRLHLETLGSCAHKFARPLPWCNIRERQPLFGDFLFNTPIFE